MSAGRVSAGRVSAVRVSAGRVSAGRLIDDQLINPLVDVIVSSVAVVGFPSECKIDRMTHAGSPSPNDQMQPGPPGGPPSPGSVINLVRSTHPWTQADSAAGFVLRYLVPMRRQLIDLLDSPAAADESLKLLLGHLVSVGFGDQKQGRLRDYLIRAVRSAAKTQVKNQCPNDSAEQNEAIAALSQRLVPVTLESRTWLAYWRDGLLQRAWRSLERIEHADLSRPLYSILSAATADTMDAPSRAEIARVASESAGRPIGQEVVRDRLPEARTAFAQFIADEIAETLESPTTQDVKAEIARLGLAKAFEGIRI